MGLWHFLWSVPIFRVTGHFFMIWILFCCCCFNESALNICCSCFSWTEWPDMDSHDPFRVSVVNVSEGDQPMRTCFAEAAAGNGTVSGEIFLNTAVKFRNCIRCLNVCQNSIFWLTKPFAANLVWWSTAMSSVWIWKVMWKDGLAFFQGQNHS